LRTVSTFLLSSSGSKDFGYNSGKNLADGVFVDVDALTLELTNEYQFKQVECYDCIGMVMEWILDRDGACHIAACS
jgi:hypothetical protein